MQFGFIMFTIIIDLMNCFEKPLVRIPFTWIQNRQRYSYNIENVLNSYDLRVRTYHIRYTKGGNLKSSHFEHTQTTIITFLLPLFFFSLFCFICITSEMNELEVYSMNLADNLISQLQMEKTGELFWRLMLIRLWMECRFVVAKLCSFHSVCSA